MERTAYGTTAAPGSEKWYYLKNGKKQGPIEGAKLASMLASGTITADTRVWTNGMDGWAAASDTPLSSAGAAAPAENNAKNADQPAAQKKSRWWIWLIVILLIGGIGAGCYFLFFGNSGNDAADDGPLYKLQNQVIYQDDFCEFVIDAIGEKGDYLELDVRCVNKTSDTLSFTWDSTCVNGSMFDPMWEVVVMGNSTMRSSITFPRSTLEGYNLLPADQIKFVLCIHNEDQFGKLYAESAAYITNIADLPEDATLEGYQQLTIPGYEDYLFAPGVQADENGRPYYTREDASIVYFDELYNRYGQPLYPKTAEPVVGYESFYNDSFGRPYYFSEYGDTVYYDGYGYAFYDDVVNKHYFFDENGNAAYYGNGGIPEFYQGNIDEAILDEEKTEPLAKAAGCYLVHKEFSIYPTGKTADDVSRPSRVTTSSEQVYWDGDKGKFIVLGGKMDDFKGYIVYAYLENNSDSYVYLGWGDAVVNGVAMDLDTITVLRPHSSAYRQIIIPASVLKENKIKSVERIDFNVYAVGENLSVPLYPIEWTAVNITDFKK